MKTGNVRRIFLSEHLVVVENGVLHKSSDALLPPSVASGNYNALSPDKLTSLLSEEFQIICEH
jgi:hypothetical protein